MRSKTAPMIVLVATLAALGVSLAWALTRGHDGGHRHGPSYGRNVTMMSPGGHGMVWYVDGSGSSVRTIAAARSQAQKFADRLDLRTGEVMQFANNLYVLLDDKQGKPATEVLVDPGSGAVTLEYGPAMMWNTRYGMMSGTGGGGMMSGTGGGTMGGGSSGTAAGDGGSGGMMGRYGGSPNWTPPSGTVGGPLTAAQAQGVANRWLAGRGNGLRAASPDALPGYYTFHTIRQGKITGMLSVNTTSGAVWEHWWHGRYVKMEE